MGTGKDPGQHKGGSGDHKSYAKPCYPKGPPERVGKTVPSPNYPRENHAGKSFKKKGY